MASGKHTEINPILKLLLEIGPLAVFFLSFRYGAEIAAMPSVAPLLQPILGEDTMASEQAPILVATALFMVAIAISLVTSWALTRSLPKMAVVTAVVVAVFGGLTLWLQDETFIKMKPTIVNGIFALILGFGLLQGRSFLKYLMGETMPLTDEGWMIFTRRWVGFFIFLGLLNEVIWRTQTTEFWVSFKTFANLPLTMVFLAFQWPLLQKHSLESPRA
ncbi:MAG: septation protein A [Pseudomonadota bacterium]